MASLVLSASIVGCSNGDDPDSTTAKGSAATTTTAGVQSSTSATNLEPVEQLRIIHPPTVAFSAPFDLLPADGELKAVARSVSSSTWATPDVLRTALVNGEAEVAAVPTNVGANLYNRDIDVRMVAVVVWGLLWLIGPDGQSGSWDDLRGQTVMMPFQNDMPDLVFRFLAEANGLKPGEDFTIEYYAQPPEVVGRLIQGAGTWAVLPEHVVTLALQQANANGGSLTRAMDLQQEWASVAGGSERIPQAGIVMPGELVDQRPDLVAALLDDLERSVETVNGASGATVAKLAEVSGLAPDQVEALIPRLNLEVVPGADARPELERFFEELARRSPDIVGGSLPDAGFYVTDPR